MATWRWAAAMGFCGHRGVQRESGDSFDSAVTDADMLTSATDHGGRRGGSVSTPTPAEPRVRAPMHTG